MIEKRDREKGPQRHATKWEMERNEKGKNATENGQSESETGEQRGGEKENSR